MVESARGSRWEATGVVLKGATSESEELKISPLNVKICKVASN